VNHGKLAGAADQLEGGDTVKFPGSGAPVAGTTWGGVHGWGEVFGVEEQPSADADPAPVKMAAENGG